MFTPLCKDFVRLGLSCILHTPLLGSIACSYLFLSQLQPWYFRLSLVLLQCCSIVSVSSRSLGAAHFYLLSSKRGKHSICSTKSCSIMSPIQAPVAQAVTVSLKELEDGNNACQ